MNLEKLNILLVLAEEQNVTHAAKRLYITQPTLTSFLNKLEKQLGFRLFDRSKSPVTLTRSGKEYIDSMQRILMEEQQLLESLREKNREQKVIRIGIGHIHSQMWMPRVVKALRIEEPNLEIQLRETQEIKLMDELKKQELDMIFSHLPTDTVNCSFDELVEEELQVMIPENLMPEELRCRYSARQLEANSISNPLVIDPALLSEIPMIAPRPNHGMFLYTKRFLEQYQVASPQVVHTADLFTAIGMVRMGIGYLYAAPALLVDHHQRGEQRIYFCSLPHPVTTRRYYVGYQNDNPNVVLIRKIRDMLRNMIRENLDDE